ncbi:MAG: DNA polymerase/3'-5' exonuclease PolX [Candidatus Deferrimicrobiaceae bacterium]
MKNGQIAVVFSEIASLLELSGENPFRIRAYQRAALNIGGLSRDVAEMTDEELRAIPGIGPDLAEKIRQFLGTGRVDLHADLKKEIPSGLLDILRVPGVGPKTAKTLYAKAGVRSLDDLETLTREGKLAGLPGIQKKTEENIRKGIDTLRKGRERHPLGRAIPIAEDMIRKLRAKAPLNRIAVAGSLRRWKETVKDIDILATSAKPEKVMEVFTGLPIVTEVLARGTTKSSVLTADGIQVDLRVVEDGSFGAALQYLTGSKEHNIKLREMASHAGLKINEYGIFRESDGKRIGGRQEGEVYKALRLPFIPPELREDTGEIEAAQGDGLPDLLTVGEIRGDLHVHTKWSDGAHDFDALVRAARKKGYQYIAITDHSKGLGIAHGLDEKRLREQIARIEEVNRTLRGFRILSGVEVDIRGDGTLDLPDAVLRELDIVIASIHSGFRQSREQITARLLSAVRNPVVGVIAHPSGRLIGERDPYDVDMEALFREAAARGVAMEVNAHPSRLDLSDHHVRMAKRYGIPLVISTDTHVTANFDYMEYGVAVARRGWAVGDDVLNTLPCRNLLKRLRSGRNPDVRSLNPTGAR